MRLFTRIVLALLFVAQVSSFGVAQSGIITTYAGLGLPLNGLSVISYAINGPTALTPDGTGGFYVVCTNQNRVYRVTADGMIRLVAGDGSAGYSGDGGPATSAALNSPYGVAVNAAGNLFIADYGNQRVRKVTPDGIISTVAGNGAYGYSGDGGPATSAKLYMPYSVAVDTAGDLFIADFYNDRIRKVTPSGIINTIAMLHYPTGVAVDAAGNSYIIAQTSGSHSDVYKATPAGIVSMVAGNGTQGFSGDGGPATSAQLNIPKGVAVDTAGNLFIADAGNSRLRKVTPGGIISTVAGNGTDGYSGDGGPATSAQLFLPIQRSGGYGGQPFHS